MTRKYHTRQYEPREASVRVRVRGGGRDGGGGGGGGGGGFGQRARMERRCSVRCQFSSVCATRGKGVLVTCEFSGRRASYSRVMVAVVEDDDSNANNDENGINDTNDDNDNNNDNQIGNDNYEGRTPNSGNAIAMYHVLNDGHGRRACTSNGTQRRALRRMRGRQPARAPRRQPALARDGRPSLAVGWRAGPSRTRSPAAARRAHCPRARRDGRPTHAR